MTVKASLLLNICLVYSKMLDCLGVHVLPCIMFVCYKRV